MRKLLTATLLATSFALAACGDRADEPADTATTVPTDAPAPTDTMPPEPTDTPTDEPTDTPTDTPTDESDAY